jgi:nucleotide-binding universal stress UspA family protein
MFDTILVPIGESERGRRALELASEIARQHDAAIHVISVVDVRYLGKEPDIEPGAESTSASLSEFVDSVPLSGLSLTTAVRHGVPHEEILAYAEDHGVDLLVMGTHGRTGLSRYLLGSVTENVVRLSEAPVLTVTESDEETAFDVENVLVPTDGSDGARAAARPAGAIAMANDATVHALSVVDIRSMGVDVRSDLILDELQTVAESAVGTIEADLTEAGVQSIRTHIVEGIPYREIQSYVDDHDIDLVVMGTHGRTGLERYLLGSVTEKVLRTSPVPVMTVRAPDTDDE